ncbi:uncharacterized protein LOC108149270 [Drosophila elegans]|uniref:uncharacterized protein LOC108149270 n=1 Tax=Drosophila elegans TaxID=30023 RepID=UPI0007E83F1C|nr:uncharacterized protein LOC108149270 [Drosophila elegans]
MESRVDSSGGQPNTIMIQLVSQQPSSSGHAQAMPISVQAIPLFPGSRTANEQSRPSDSLSPNMRPPAKAPPRMHSRIRPEMCAPPKRMSSQNEFKCSYPRYSSSGVNQPPVRYVVRSADRMLPIYIPSPRTASNSLGNVRGGRMEGECPCCGVPLIPGKETLGLLPPQEKENLGRRDQATNTDGQTDLVDLQTICESLGRAVMAAAMAAMESAQKNHLEKPTLVSRSTGPERSKDPTNITFQKHTQSPSQNKQKQLEAEITGDETTSADEKIVSDDEKRVSQHKTSFLNTVLVGRKLTIGEKSSDEMLELTIPSRLSDGRFHVEYPKTPRPTPEFIRASVNIPYGSASEHSRLNSGALETGGTPIGNSNIISMCQRAGLVLAKPLTSAGKPLVGNQVSALIAAEDFRSVSIRRRFPTEKLPPAKTTETSGPTSPNSSLTAVKQSEDP